MATGNLLLGQASGAVGSLVFARANGQQVTKARQELVRYSNTLAQAIQRICISTAGQAYRHMQEVCCRSFQGIQPGKATHDEFMKRNVRLLRQSIRQADAQGLTYSDLRYFTPVGNDTLLPNAYIVSSGSLPTISSNIISNDPTHARLAGVGSSYQDIISFYGLKRGDILTFVFMQPDSSGIVRARSARVVLDPWSPISGKASLDVPFIAAGNMVNCPNPSNSGEFTYLVNDSGNIIYSLVNSDVPLIAAGVFASRRTAASSWLHSDCQLTVYDDSDILNNFTLQQAIDVANGAPIAAISPDYLNNAGTAIIHGSNNIKEKFQFIDYAITTPSCYLNLSRKASNFTRIVIDFKLTSTGLLVNRVFGNFRNYAKSFSFAFSQSGNCRFGSQLIGNFTPEAGIKYHIENSQSGLYINGNLIKAWVQQSFETEGDCCLLASTNEVEIPYATLNNGLSGLVYSIQWYEREILIHDLVPAIRKIDNIVGFYDNISNTFYESFGSEQFSAE